MSGMYRVLASWFVILGYSPPCLQRTSLNPKGYTMTKNSGFFPTYESREAGLIGAPHHSPPPNHTFLPFCTATLGGTTSHAALWLAWSPQRSSNRGNRHRHRRSPVILGRQSPRWYSNHSGSSPGGGFACGGHPRGRSIDTITYSRPSKDSKTHKPGSSTQASEGGP